MDDYREVVAVILDQAKKVAKNMSLLQPTLEPEIGGGYKLTMRHPDRGNISIVISFKKIPKSEVVERIYFSLRSKEGILTPISSRSGIFVGYRGQGLKEFEHNVFRCIKIGVNSLLSG